MFSITMGKGFTMQFPNGVVASVQWGTANYCERHSCAPDAWNASQVACFTTGKWDSEDAEVACWMGNATDFMRKDKWLTREMFDEEMHDGVKGHLNVTEVMQFLNRCQSWAPVVQVK